MREKHPSLSSFTETSSVVFFFSDSASRRNVCGRFMQNTKDLVRIFHLLRMFSSEGHTECLFLCTMKAPPPGDGGSGAPPSHVKTATLQCFSLEKRLLESLMLLLNRGNRWMCGITANTQLGTCTLPCEEAAAQGAPCGHTSPFHRSGEDK